MAEIEDKVILDHLRESKIIDENVINDVYRMYMQLKNAGDSIKLVDVFVNRGYLTHSQVQDFTKINTNKSLQKIGQYELIKKLGAGGMGSVYLARKSPSDPLVALKILPKSSSQNEKIISRFNREFRALQQLKHPTIIAGIEKGFANGYHFYVMEYFEGQNLKTFIEKNHPIDFSTAVSFIKEIAIGLKFASDLGMIHRDIKPDNIIITSPDQKIKIIDFGLVKMEHEDSMNLTKTQTAMGTPHFMSCEQAKDAKNADLRSDIYSLGATLFYMVTNEYPVNGATAYEVLAALISGQVKNPKEINPNIPENLNRLILNMMAQDAKDRYQNYDLLLNDINSYLGEKKIKNLSPILFKSKIFISMGIISSLIILLTSYFIWIKKDQPTTQLPQKIENNTRNIETKNQPTTNNEDIKELPKEVLKYRIVNAFDREFKRRESMAKFETLNGKLDDYLDYLAKNEITEKNTFEEDLITRAFTLLAFCGAGYDFYQAPERKMMERYLKYIIESQVEPGKWSSEIWVNVVCTNAIIESFAMYGSDNQQLSKVSLDALAQLEKQSNEFTFDSVSENILGSHLFVTAFTFAKIAGLSRHNQLSEEQLTIIRNSIKKTVSLRASVELLMADKMDIEAVAQITGKQRDFDLFLRIMEEKSYKPKNCKEAYFMLLIFGIQRDKQDNRWLLTNASDYFMQKGSFENEVPKYSNKNGTIITYAIAALAIENIYRIPREAIPYKRKDFRLRDEIMNRK